MKQGHSVVRILSFRVCCLLLPKERREVCIRARSRSRKGSGRICVLVVMSVFFPCLDPRFSCIASETECRGFLKVLEQYRIILLCSPVAVFWPLGSSRADVVLVFFVSSSLGKDQSRAVISVYKQTTEGRRACFFFEKPSFTAS